MNRESRAYTPYADGKFMAKAALYASLIAALLFLSVYVGSEGFAYVDLALYGYLWASVLGILLFTVRIAAWCARPPASRLWKQGLKMFASFKGWKFLLGALVSNIGAQRFVGKRSWYRWAQHML